MNWTQLINMLTRMFGNRLLNWGVRRMNAPKPGEKRTAEQRRRDKAARETTKRFQQVTRILRRMR